MLIDFRDMHFFSFLANTVTKMLYLSLYDWSKKDFWLISDVQLTNWINYDRAVFSSTVLLKLILRHINLYPNNTTLYGNLYWKQQSTESAKTLNSWNRQTVVFLLVNQS